MVKMVFPKGHGGVSVAGAQYKPGKNGEVDVDDNHVTEALSHGGELAGSDEENEASYASMTVADLRVAFANRFHHEAPPKVRKESLLDALEKGWSVFSVDDLREAYRGRFNTEAPTELKKADLIEALEAEGE